MTLSLSLVLVAACSRSGVDHPLTSPPDAPGEQVVQAGGGALRLRCDALSPPLCHARAEAIAAPMAQAGPGAADGLQALLERDDLVVAAGAWPVRIDHPLLPTGQTLAELTLTDRALGIARGDGPVALAVVSHALPGRAAALAIRALAEGPATPSTEDAAWVLLLTRDGVVQELGEPAPGVTGLRLTP